MSYVLVRITVEDYAKWRPVFDEVSHLRKNSGSQGGQLFRRAEAPNEVTILFEWPDLNKARQYFQSDALRQAMQRAGVQGRPDVTYLDTVERLSA
jgi:heme-degrading monooxygenase HmoA